VDGDGHSVAQSAPATHAGAFWEVDVVADDIHDVGCIAAADWLASTFGGGDFNMVQVPVPLILMMAFLLALEVVTIAPENSARKYRQENPAKTMAKIELCGG
jgi:hypothetical protein